MRLLGLTCTLLLAVFFISCGPSDEEKARTRLNYAKKLLENSDTTNAILQLDTISKYFPKAVYSKNAAKNMMNEINFDLLRRKETELDSVKSEISGLESLFVKQKTEFDRFTQYIPKRQTTDNSMNRSFLQVHLDERGDIYLSSNFYGKSALNHTGIKVYDGDLSAQTDSVPVGDVNNHQSDFMEYKWEKVSYRDGKDNGVIRFIAENAGRKLKAVFLGKSRFYIILEDYDKEAVKNALALSEAIKKRMQLETEVKNLQTQLQIE